jgi:hypothetical protein
LARKLFGTSGNRKRLKYAIARQSSVVGLRVGRIYLFSPGSLCRGSRSCLISEWNRISVAFRDSERLADGNCSDAGINPACDAGSSSFVSSCAAELKSKDSRPRREHLFFAAALSLFGTVQLNGNGRDSLNDGRVTESWFSLGRYSDASSSGCPCTSRTY